MPPAYPAGIALLHALGVPLVDAGVGIALVLAAATPPAVMLAARTAGASRAAAALGALATALLPDLMGTAVQLQPDSAIALAAVALGGLLAASVRSRTAAWMAAFLAGTLPLLREHGLPLAGLAGLALLLMPGGRGPALALLATLWLAPLLVGVLPGSHPLDLPWSDRPGGALAVLGHARPEDVPYARTLPPGPRQAYLRLVAEGRTLGLLHFHAARSLHLAWDGWLLLAAALGLALWSRRREAILLALPVLAAAPALLIWSQRRHVLVMAPVAIAALAASRLEGRASRRVRAGALLALALGVAWPWAGAWRALGPAQHSEVARARSFASVGAWLQESAPPGSLLGGVFQDVGLYVPLPRHDPDGSAADWRTFLVSDRPPRDPRWERVHAALGGLSIYQLLPEVSPRPCAEARPAPGSPHLAVAAAHAELVDADAGCAPPQEAERGATR